MLRRRIAVVVALAALTMLVAPVIAQAQDVIEVSVQDPSFSWTGKEGQRANFSWSASVDNPSRRDLLVRVTLQLLDAEGNVVASDSQQLTVMGEGRADVEGTSYLAYSDATEATEYRVTLEEGVEE